MDYYKNSSKNMKSSDATNYWRTTFLVALMSWLYWESMNSYLLDWWAIDGYPTYVAAKLWLSGQPEAIYHTQLWIPDSGHTAWTKMMAQHGIPNSSTTFVYHPLYLLALTPFIRFLELSEFTYLLVGINAIFNGLLASESIRLAGGGDLQREKVSLALVCISFPAMYSAFLGQNVLPTLVLVLIGWRCISTGQLLLGALLLTLSVAMKVWTLPLVFVMFLMISTRAVFYGIAVLTTGLLVFPWLVDSQLLTDYFDIASRLSKITVYPYNNVSIRGILERLATPNWVIYAYNWKAIYVSARTRLFEVAILLVIGISFAASWLKWRPPAPVTFTSLLCLILLLPGVCWTHYLVFAIPTAVILWLSAEGASASVGLTSLLLLALPWHPFPGGILSRAPLRQMITEHPHMVEFLMALPSCLILILAYTAVSASYRSSGSPRLRAINE